MSNSPGNEPELAKITSVDDRHISAPWGSITMETALGPKMVSNSQQNGSKLDKTVSVDDGHVNAPRESSIMEITLGPQNCE